MDAEGAQGGRRRAIDFIYEKRNFSFLLNNFFFVESASNSEILLQNYTKNMEKLDSQSDTKNISETQRS